MNLPSWNADTAATVQAVVAIGQAILTVLALIAAIGIPWWQQRQSRKEDHARRSAELAGVRLALHTEVGMIGQLCLFEMNSWTKAASPPAQRNLRTAKLPPLVIYEANANRIGLLTRDEILGLIGFCGTLHDISIVVADMERRQAQGPDDRQTLRMLLSNACGHAANFLDAVPGIEDARRDRPFIAWLRKAEREMEASRAAAKSSFFTPG